MSSVFNTCEKLSKRQVKRITLLFCFIISRFRRATVANMIKKESTRYTNTTIICFSSLSHFSMRSSIWMFFASIKLVWMSLPCNYFHFKSYLNFSFVSLLLVLLSWLISFALPRTHCHNFFYYLLPEHHFIITLHVYYSHLFDILFIFPLFSAFFTARKHLILFVVKII